ncbi:hypothetical protein PROFUN_14815 [Planoprotostelium fungivorum]|uniref:Uncharacterized protein n=1 Tax=Planoprotostelium fungivorum TaxID=1890364 RepID=A0A2P6MYB9_9EUKA|nr:hypothetical protein PROFUN_14815 [Planoprotostelium fungivorum]
MPLSPDVSTVVTLNHPISHRPPRSLKDVALKDVARVDQLNRKMRVLQQELDDEWAALHQDLVQLESSIARDDQEQILKHSTSSGKRVAYTAQLKIRMKELNPQRLFFRRSEQMYNYAFNSKYHVTVQSVVQMLWELKSTSSSEVDYNFSRRTRSATSHHNTPRTHGKIYCCLAFAQYQPDPNIYIKDHPFDWTTLSSFSDSNCQNRLSARVVRVDLCSGGGNQYAVGFCAVNSTAPNYVFLCGADATCIAVTYGQCVANSYPNIAGAYLRIDCTEPFPRYPSDSVVYTFSNSCGSANASYLIQDPQNTCQEGNNELISCANGQSTFRQCNGGCGACETNSVITRGENCFVNDQAAYTTATCGGSFETPSSGMLITPFIFISLAAMLLF